jgi:hypothetical protein
MKRGARVSSQAYLKVGVMGKWEDICAPCERYLRSRRYVGEECCLTCFFLGDDAPCAVLASRLFPLKPRYEVQEQTLRQGIYRESGSEL